jgi:L-amino acid N-acyltransferase YncA
VAVAPPPNDLAELRVRDATPADIPAMTAIQNALIPTTTIEWTDALHTEASRLDWLAEKEAAGFPVLVAEVGGAVVGWAAYGEFRDSIKWPGYRFVVEHTVHVQEEHWGGGVGRLLLHALIERARAAGIHVMVGAVDGANDASIRFHERLGFVEVARMPEVGAKHGRWLDLVLLQLVLDDRPTPPG